MKRKTAVLLGALFLGVGFSVAVVAVQSRVIWIPFEIKPESMAPGDSRVYEVSFVNVGPSDINMRQVTPQLKMETNGIVSIASTSFPQVVKIGKTGKVFLRAKIPAGAANDPAFTGTLSLVWKDGGKNLFLADKLPIWLTISGTPLPPDPGEEGKATVEGVVTNPYKIRDDVLRAVFFTFPNPADEPKRNALIQYAQADQRMFADYLALEGDPAEQKRVVREDAKMRAMGYYCMSYVFGVHEIPLGQGRLDERFARRNEVDAASDALIPVFQNTKERIRIFRKTNALLGGTGSDNPPASEVPARDAAACDQNLLD